MYVSWLVEQYETNVMATVGIVKKQGHNCIPKNLMRLCLTALHAHFCKLFE